MVVNHVQIIASYDCSTNHQIWHSHVTRWGESCNRKRWCCQFLQDLIGAIRKPSSLPDLNSPLSLSAHRLCCTIKQTALSILLQPVASSMKRSHEDKVHLTQDRERLLGLDCKNKRWAHDVEVELEIILDWWPSERACMGRRWDDIFLCTDRGSAVHLDGERELLEWEISWECSSRWSNWLKSCSVLAVLSWAGQRARWQEGGA